MNTEILYDVEWQLLRISLSKKYGRGFGNESDVLHGLNRLTSYLRKASGAQELRGRFLRIQTLLIEVLQGYGSNPEYEKPRRIVHRFLEISVNLKLTQIEAEMTPEEKLFPDWDWEKVRTELAWIYGTNRLQFLTLQGDLKSRKENPALKQFLDLMKEVEYA